LLNLYLKDVLKVPSRAPPTPPRGLRKEMNLNVPPGGFRGEK
jgi:hypothetical protein